MLKYILKRLLLSIPLVLGIVTATFFIARLAPGDPMDMYLEPQRQRQVDPEVIELMRKRYGLDQPIHVQYVTWVKNVAKGDFGESFRHRRPVRDIVAEAVPYTLQLTILALLLDALFGISLGIISAVKQYSKLDKTLTVGSLIVYAIPSFGILVGFEQEAILSGRRPGLLPPGLQELSYRVGTGRQVHEPITAVLTGHC